VSIHVNVTDVREGSTTGGDYDPPPAPDMKILLRLRITDLSNGASQDELATVSDTDFEAPVICAFTTDSTIGSTCSIDTTANAVLPSFVNQGARTLWELIRVRVFDSGSNGVLDDSDDTLFAQQGIFVP
jgi:hypothetical protein